MGIGPTEPEPTASEPESDADAEAALDAALALDPRTAAAWRARGDAFRRLGRRAEALHAYKQATELDPTDGAAWLGRGDVLLSFGGLDDALADYERAIELVPRSLEAWYGKHEALGRLGRREERALAASQLSRVLLGKKPTKRRYRGPARSPVAVLGATFGPIAREFWTARRPLLVPALAYVAGLAVWSLNAARNDLGPQVAADLQYLVAGVIPALVVLAGVALLLVLLAAPAWTRHWLATRAPRTQHVLAQIAAVAFSGSLLLAVLGPSLDEIVPSEAILLVFAASLVLAVFVSEEGWFFNLVWKFWGVTGVAVLLTLAFVFYAEAVYPGLPQALGGGEPRCARLDLQTGLLSRETVDTLVPEAARAEPPETARTGEVDVLFARDDVLFVRTRGGGEGAATHELRGDAVRAVVGCGEGAEDRHVRPR
jgi:hypothetical protein